MGYIIYMPVDCIGPMPIINFKVQMFQLNHCMHNIALYRYKNIIHKYITMTRGPGR